MNFLWSIHTSARMEEPDQHLKKNFRQPPPSLPIHGFTGPWNPSSWPPPLSPVAPSLLPSSESRLGTISKCHTSVSTRVLSCSHPSIHLFAENKQNTRQKPMAALCGHHVQLYKVQVDSCLRWKLHRLGKHWAGQVTEK